MFPAVIGFFCIFQNNTFVYPKLKRNGGDLGNHSLPIIALFCLVSCPQSVIPLSVNEFRLILRWLKIRNPFWLCSVWILPLSSCRLWKWNRQMTTTEVPHQASLWMWEQIRLLTSNVLLGLLFVCTHLQVYVLFWLVHPSLEEMPVLCRLRNKKKTQINI